LVTSCAGDVGRLVGAGKFNTELLQSGGLVIGGVSSVSGFGLQQSVDYAEILQQLIQQQVPKIATVGPREVYKALGRNLYAQMLDSYTFHETGSTAFMNLLHEKFPDTRYVLYARIENDAVQHQHEKLTDGSGFELHSIRGVTVSMRVFDLNSRQLQVWAAGLSQVDANSRRVFGQYSDAQLKNLFPEPPASEKVFSKTCSGLLAELISKKK
jgi:hypothetical protein